MECAEIEVKMSVHTVFYSLSYKVNVNFTWNKIQTLSSEISNENTNTVRYYVAISS